MMSDVHIASTNDRSNHVEMIEEAKLRGNIYDFLSGIYLEEINPELLKVLKNPRINDSFQELGVNFAKDLEGDNHQQLLEQLAEAYCYTFITGGGGLAPYESVQRHGCYEGKSAIQVKDFYLKCSFQLPDGSQEFVDHLGLEMDFMTKMIEKEADLRSNGLVDEMEQNQKYQQDFLRQHLLVWAPDFAQKIIKSGSHPFYKSIGQVTKGFLAMESKRYDLS